MWTLINNSFFQNLHYVLKLKKMPSLFFTNYSVFENRGTEFPGGQYKKLRHKKIRDSNTPYSFGSSIQCFKTQINV